jgi:hypothetical protein
MTALYTLAVLLTAASACCMWLTGLPWALPGLIAGILASVATLTELLGERA